MFSHDDPSTSGEISSHPNPELDGKGKGVTKPVPIRVPAASIHDLFDMTQSASTAPSTSRGSRHSVLVTPSLTPSSFRHGRNTCRVTGEGQGKGIPTLSAPLTFSPPEFYFAPSSPAASSSPGPSSYASSCGPPLGRVNTNPESKASTLAEEFSALPRPTAGGHEGIPAPLNRIATRRRSLPSFSAHSDGSLGARSMARVKLKLASSRTSSSLARKLLFRKPSDPEVSRPDSLNTQTVAEEHLAGAENSPDPWRTGLKVDELDATISRLSHLRLEDIDSKPANLFCHATMPLRHKGRSNSSPFPISALDYVPLPSTDIFTPFPLVVKNYFDDVLPHELRLQIFEALIARHEADHIRAIADGRWSVAKAASSKSRWVGRDKGVRELVKLSRVSKSWQALAFDGQLWADLDLRSFPHMPESLVLRLTATGGQCSRALDISGHAQLSPETLLDMADHFCVNTNPNIDSLCYTQLTAINLRGCSSLTTRSLHSLLVRSRSLQSLCVKGLTAVTNTTCDVLSTYCPRLVSLDISRCPNLDAEGIRSMASAALDRGEHLLLKELRMSGLKHIDDDTMAALGRAAPFLEVLDLSYARQLHNSAVEAFVACGADEDPGVETILVSPRDVGRESSDFKFRRRVTGLRHLSMSCCLLLTDDACSNLAYSVPRLEFLELAGIGADLKDDGLVRLLKTTPYIRRIDLEDASRITDVILVAITPGVNAQPRLADVAPEPGHALEQLNISFASEITDDALLALVRGCTRLKHLEADNTRIGGTVVKEFVRQCKKQKMENAKAVVVDCRGVSDGTVKDLLGLTRPRMGWRAHEARKLTYLDTRDGNSDELKIGQDECDEKRVVLKSFYSWQSVDAVKAAREKRRKASKRASSGSGSDLDDVSGRALRWWSPGGRRSPRSGRSSPLNIADMNSDGCRVM
ncbi:putative leucine-rich repeats, outliers [Lyophyllum shimeji]|uniref:Leucine-rich repeats, outliers n=1 Tax=Lyophyllum shimeji TaxID=47721 RepID=A0A9P3PXN8_LYOSH|nr:putative leucine-rich repeats, outliers [Lyophyllum shimeji]